MNKKIKYILITVVIVSLMAIAYIYGTKVGRSPDVIFQAGPDDTNLLQWQKNHQLAGDSIVSATVVNNTNKELTVYVDYIYSGSHGNNATTCGSVLNNGNGGYWSCFPTGIARGRGFVTLKFKLTDRAKGIICSDAIRINYYDRNGKTFFKKIVPFKKKWVQGRLNVTDKIKASMPGCPSENIKGKDTTVKARLNVLENLLSTDEVVIRKAYEALYNELSGRSPRLYLKNHKKLFDTLAIALHSHDLRTTHYASAIIYQLAIGTFVTRQGTPTTIKYPDIRKSDNLKRAIVKAINDSEDKDVNRLSAASLVQAYNVTPDMETFLVSQFQRSEHSPVIKAGILTALSFMVNPSLNPSGFFHKETMPVVIKAISNPDKDISRAAIAIIIETKTKAALPFLVDKLKETDNPYITKSVLMALKKQKENARNYVTELEGIINGLPDGQYKTDLSGVIEYLKHN